MPSEEKGSHPVGLYIDGLKGEMRDVAAALRRVVLAAAPGMNEVIMWGRPWFEHHGPVCYLAANRAHVTFGFRRGTDLTDPKGMLEGTGKGMRHLKVRRVDEIPRDVVSRWVRQAVRLNRAGGGK